MKLREVAVVGVGGTKFGRQAERSVRDLAVEASLKAIKDANVNPKEIQVAQLIREGNNTRDIAELLGSSRRTIESHRQSIRTKLGVKDTKGNLRSHLLSM